MCVSQGWAVRPENVWDKYTIFGKRSKNRIRGTPARLSLCPTTKSLPHMLKLSSKGLADGWSKYAMSDGTPIFVDASGMTHWTMPIHDRSFSVLGDNEEKHVEQLVGIHARQQADLDTVADYKTEVVCREGKHGNGLHAVVWTPPHKAVSMYDGHRVTREGKIQLLCPRMSQLLTTYPNIEPEAFEKDWSITVDRQAAAQMAIDGRAAAHPSLNELPDHGGIGTGSVVNSSRGSGKRANCIVKMRPRVIDPLINVSGLFFDQGPQSQLNYDVVIYTTCAGDQHFIDMHMHASKTLRM